MAPSFPFEYPQHKILIILILLAFTTTTQHVFASSTSTSTTTTTMDVKYNVSIIVGGKTLLPAGQNYGDGFPARMSCNAFIFHMVQTADGSIYMSDSTYHVIRKVDGKSGVISVLAGQYTFGHDGNNVIGTSASLTRPSGMVLNKNETLLYFVSGSNCVRVIDLTSGMISTVVGNCGSKGILDSDNVGEVLFNNPTSIALSTDESLIYVSDLENNAIRRFDLKTFRTTTVFNVNSPNAILLDGDLLYVAQGLYGNLLFLNVSNNFQHVFPQLSDLKYPGSLFKKGEMLYIAEQEAGRVIAYNISAISNNDFKQIVVASGILKPYGVLLDSNDNLIVSENVHNVYNITKNGEKKLFSGSCNTKVFAGLPEGQESALATSLSLKPQYLSTNYFATNDLMIFHLNTSSGIATFKAGTGFLYEEFSVLTEGTLAYNSTLGRIMYSITEANGEIYFTNGSLIAKIDKNNGKIVIVANIGYSGGNSFNGLLGNGTSLYVSDFYSVSKINLLSNSVEVIAVNSTSTRMIPGRMAIDPTDGNIVFFDRHSCTVRKVIPNLGIITIAGIGECANLNSSLPATSTTLHRSDIEYLSNGDLILAEYTSCRIFKLIKATNTFTLITKSQNCYTYINRVSISTDKSNGNLYISDLDDQVIRKFVPYCEEGYILNSSGTECILFSINAKLDSTLTFTDSSFQVTLSVSNNELSNILSKTKFTILLNNEARLQNTQSYPTTITLETKIPEGNYSVSIQYLINGKIYSTFIGIVKVLSYEKIVQESFLKSASASDVASVALNIDTYSKAADSTQVVTLVTNALATSGRNTSNLDETSHVTKALNVISSLSTVTTSVISKVSTMVNEISTDLTKLSSTSLQSSFTIDTTVSQVLNTFSNIISSNIYVANSTEVIDNMLIVSSKASSVKDNVYRASTSSFVVSVVRNANISEVSNGNTSIVTPNNLLMEGVSVASVNYLNVDKLSKVFESSAKLTSNFTNISDYLSNATMVNIVNPIDLKYISNGNFLQVTELVNPIKLSFTIENSTILASNMTITCRYFNETTREWLSNGCTTQIDSISATVTCLCNHTTTFSAFVESKLNTKVDKDIAIAGIVLGSLLILFTIITLIGVISTYRKTPTKSRGIIPYLSLISILIELVFLFIVSNAILLSNNTRASSTVKYVSTFISSLFYCLAILNYTILNVRYLAFRYVYEIMAKLDEKKVDMTNDKRFKWIKFILTGKSFIVILNLVFSIIFISFYAIFLGLIASESISSTVYTDVMAGSIFAFVMTMSLIVCVVYLFDSYMEFSYAQLNTKLIAKDKKLLVNPIKNYFILNDNLGFRKEFIFFFMSMIFFVISYGVGFSSLQKPSDTASAVIFAFDVLYNIMLIMSFGGCVSVISIYEHIRQKLYSKVEDNGDEDDYSDSQLKEILLSPSLCEVFKQFAKTEHSLENILFYQKLYPIFERCNKGELPSNTELGKEFEDWKVTFIENNSPLEVNYSHITKKSFISIYESILKNERDDKQVKEVLSDMYCALTMNLDDTFSRFVLTEGFDKMNKLFELKEQMSSTLKLQD